MCCNSAIVHGARTTAAFKSVSAIAARPTVPVTTAAGMREPDCPGQQHPNEDASHYDWGWTQEAKPAARQAIPPGESVGLEPIRGRRIEIGDPAVLDCGSQAC